LRKEERGKRKEERGQGERDRRTRRRRDGEMGGQG